MTLADALRPYLWLAAVGFLVGFMTYLAMGRPADAYAQTPRVAADVMYAPVARSGPASEAWNLPKRI